MLNEDLVKKNWDNLKKSVLELTDRPVKIVAVTKAHPETIYDICLKVGIVEIGENRMQELLAKNESRPEARKKFKIHLIGPLQTNKVKFLSGNADYLDTVSSLETVLKINERWNQPDKLPVLLQINSTDEITKAGIHYQQKDTILALAKACIEAPKIRLEGFMTMGPTPEGSYDRPDKKYEDDTKKAFLRTRELRDVLQNELGQELSRLSMGMTHDFDLAIECGSTEIRVGSLLFGERELPIR